MQVLSMYVYMCILGLGAQGRTRPERKSGMFTDSSETASHCQDSDLQCGHCSPGEVIDAIAFPWGLEDIILLKLEFGKVSVLHTHLHSEVGGTWIFPSSDFQPMFSPSQAAALPFRSPNSLFLLCPIPETLMEFGGMNQEMWIWPFPASHSGASQ